MAGNFCRSPIHLLFSIRDDPTLATSTLPCVCCIFRMQAVESARIGSVGSQTWDILTAHAAMPAFHVGVIMYLAGEVCSEQHRQKKCIATSGTYLIERPAAHSGAATLSLATFIRFPIPLSQSPSTLFDQQMEAVLSQSLTHLLTHSLTPSPPSYKSPSLPPRTSPYTLYPPAATPAYQSNTPYHFPDPLSKTD